MAVPGSGNPITMRGIFSEKNEDDYGADNMDGESNLSLRGLSSNSFSDTSTGGNIDLNSAYASSAEGGANLINAPYAISEFRGYDHDAVSFSITANNTPSVPQQWGNTSGSSATNASAGCTVGFQFRGDTAGKLVRLRQGNFNNSTALSYSYISITYDGSASSASAQVTWSGSTSGTGSFTNGSGRTSGAFVSLATGTADSGSFTDWTWTVSKSSGNGTHSYSTMLGTSPSWQVRFFDGGGSTLGTTNSSNGNAIVISATRGSGGGGFGPVCIHEDMLVDTAVGPMHIDDVVEKDPRVWSYNPLSREKELVELVNVAIVYHDNLYAINGEYLLTEDHIMYDINKNPKSIKPELALSNYNKQSEKLKLGDELSTLSGDTYFVKSIEKYEGKHKTYTISTVNDTFYAGDILVDSEI